MTVRVECRSVVRCRMKWLSDDERRRCSANDGRYLIVEDFLDFLRPGEAAFDVIGRQNKMLIFEFISPCGDFNTQTTRPETIQSASDFWGYDYICPCMKSFSIISVPLRMPNMLVPVLPSADISQLL